MERDLRLSPRQRYLSLLGVVAAAMLLLLPWWRNHAVLVDFYDYGIVMSAASRLSLGEHPYVDFLTPIQSLHLLQAWWTEALLGPRYLNLTYANAVFIAVSFGFMVALLRRFVGLAVAGILAAAVVAASSGQHTIVWHNAMGVAWLAGVVWIVAPKPERETPLAGWRGVCLVLFLWLGGMTKLTYQVSALAFAVLFALRNGWWGYCSWRKAAATVALYLVAGVGLPLATELVLTGATFAQWWYNVIELPSSRSGLLAALLTGKFYWHTPHDYYPPLYFGFVGAWGVGCLLVLAGLAIRGTGGVGSPGRRRALVVALVAGGWICGGVLLATNLDIAYLAGAAWLVFATGLALATLADESGRINRTGRMVLAVAGLSLLLPAWQAAWNGTRALWGPFFTSRAELMAVDSLPGNYAYFRGLKVPAGLYETMRALAVRRDRFPGEDRSMDRFYFVNSAEWLTRAYPSARLAGLPLWLHQGTSYREEEAKVIEARLAEGRTVEGVMSFGHWDKWFYGMDWYLQARYRHERVGPLGHLYLLRDDALSDWRQPLEFALATGSTVDGRDLLVSGGPFALCPSNSGKFLGAPRSAAVEIRQPLTELRGEVVLRRTAAAGTATIRAIWRATAIGDGGKSEILREETIEIAGDEAERVMALAVQPERRRIRLDVFLPPDERLEGGFRRLHARYASEEADKFPPLFDPSLAMQPNPEKWAEALFAAGSREHHLRGAGLTIFADESGDGPELFAHAPSEVWFQVAAGSKRAQGEFRMRPVTWTERGALDGVVARVVYYRPGQIHVLFERTLHPKEVPADRENQRFDVALPPGGEAGWLALIYTPLKPGQYAFGHMVWRKIEIQ